jgi:alpha-beta hydrolase superfamily lysophospholipase
VIWLRRLVKAVVAVVGLAALVLVTVVVAFAFQARLNLPPLHAWHRLQLREEFRAGGAGAPASFDDYLRLEDRLFAEVRSRILSDPAAADTMPLGRYRPGSVAEKWALETRYNRSFELAPPSPKGAVLLVHGLSDSPYSMRALAEDFFAQGYYVLVLRLPGHGTIPSGLVDVSWNDWFAAVTLAAKHAAARKGSGPFLAGGHSTGAALLSLYSVRSLDDPSLPRPARLYLVSPAIGISPFAVMTNVVAALSPLPYFEKSKWLDVLPEYDPFKFNSFPVNAGNQIHRLTRVLAAELGQASERGRLDAMPRVVVFQSLVDSTVTANEVVHGLLNRLPARGHELVVFDVNRRADIEGFLSPGLTEAIGRLENAPSFPFRVTVVANRPDGSAAIRLRTRAAGESQERDMDLPLEWPKGVVSVGHVSLPFPPDDPVYGLDPQPVAGDPPVYPLGALAIRGESGALTVPLAAFSRLRSNPFFEVIRATVRRTLAEDADAPPPAGGAR